MGSLQRRIPQGPLSELLTSRSGWRLGVCTFNKLRPLPRPSRSFLSSLILSGVQCQKPASAYDLPSASPSQQSVCTEMPPLSTAARGHRWAQSASLFCRFSRSLRPASSLGRRPRPVSPLESHWQNLPHGGGLSKHPCSPKLPFYYYPHPSDPLRPQRWSPLTQCPVGWRCPTRQPQGSQLVTAPLALQLHHLERAASSCEDTDMEGDFSRGGDRGEVSQTLSLQITQSRILGRGREWCG